MTREGARSIPRRSDLVPLEHEQEPHTKSAPGPPLSSADLSAILDSAIARHSEALRSDQTTLEEAIDIARQLNIPEEHVIAAAEELRRRKIEEAAEQRHGMGRSLRRARIRAGRRTAFLIASALAALLIVPWFLDPASPTRPTTGYLILCALPAVFFAWRWLISPVSDAQADRVELPLAAGTCRVCQAPASTPQSTFCEEHRYRGPGA